MVRVRFVSVVIYIPQKISPLSPADITKIHSLLPKNLRKGDERANSVSNLTCCPSSGAMIERPQGFSGLDALPFIVSEYLDSIIYSA